MEQTEESQKIQECDETENSSENKLESVDEITSTIINTDPVSESINDSGIGKSNF